MKTLVILVHPDIENSKINKKWKEELEKHPDKITVHELYKEYPDWNINIEKEQELITKHDNIIFEFPLYWYSSPPILKKWLDDVLSFNWAYGNEYRLKEKNIGFAVSVGGPKKEYSKTGSVRFSMDEILVPFEATVKYIKANLISHYILFDATESLNEKKLLESAEGYVKHIFNIK